MQRNPKLADIKLTSTLSATGGKAKASGTAEINQTDDVIEFANTTLTQTSRTSSFFIFKYLNLKNVRIDNINREKRTAHLTANIEFSGSNEVAQPVTQSWGSYFASSITSAIAAVAPAQKIDSEVPFQTNEDETQVKVRFSVNGTEQKITATLKP